LERDGKVGVHLDGPRNGRVSRLEVIEGASGRRLRTKAERARIAAESLVPGTSVTDVARRHGTTRWQIYDWRKKLRTGQLAVSESLAALPMFAELVIKGICHATGRMHVSDSEELHLIPMTIQVKIKPPKNGYGESNAIAYTITD